MILIITAECSMALTFASVTESYHDMAVSDTVTR